MDVRAREAKDWGVPEWSSPYLREIKQYTRRPLRLTLPKLRTPDEYVRMVRRVAPWTREVDWRLIAGVWREPAVTPADWKLDGCRGELWLDYWDATQPRPEVVGSCYNDHPEDAARAWARGIPPAYYPLYGAHLIPVDGRPHRQRLRAVLRLARKARIDDLRGVPDELKTADLCRLSRLGGAFLRGLLVDNRIKWVDGRVDWEAVAEFQKEWLSLPREALQTARVFAVDWMNAWSRLEPGEKVLFRRNPEGWGWKGGWWQRPESLENIPPVPRVWWAQRKREMQYVDYAGRVVETSAVRDSLRRLRPSLDQTPLRAAVSSRLKRHQTIDIPPLAEALGCKPVEVLLLTQEEYERQEGIRWSRYQRRPKPFKRKDYAAIARRRKQSRSHIIRREMNLLRSEWKIAWSDAVRRAEWFRIDPSCGGLVGIRLFSLRSEEEGDPLLQSPYRHTPWYGPMLRTDECETGRVREAPGIHAYWFQEEVPQINPRVLRELGNIDNPILGEVRGYGKYAAGPEGWRAQEVVIVRLIIVSSLWGDIVPALRDRYQVPVELRKKPKT